MYKIPDEQCEKCGGDTTIRWIPSCGMDINKTGMKRTCSRCGYEKFEGKKFEGSGKVNA